MSRLFSFTRWWGIVLKEFLQLRRDRLTFGMIIGIPVAQLILFGFAINTDPHNLPTAVISYDNSEITRSFLQAMENSGYFSIVGSMPDEESGRSALAQGLVQFVVNIPSDFTAKLLRGEQSPLLIEADATDPLATGMALSALGPIAASIVKRDLGGAALAVAPSDNPLQVQVHRLFNPEGIPRYNVVPGLLGTIMTMTMVMMTGLAMTRERERGTMENLLATPARPLEVMTGKIVPYIAIGLVQCSIIIAAASFIFHVPIQGGLGTVYLACLLFVAANLTVGITLSSLASNQLQAMQLTIFYFLPNLLLSGFMFPFRGMPNWAQNLGNILPLTHFNRLIRGIMLKGNAWPDLWPSIWPLLIFTAVVLLIALKFYRKTLD